MKFFDLKTISEISGIILLSVTLGVLKVYNIVKLSWWDVFCPIIITLTVFSATAFMAYIVFLSVKICNKQQ